MKTKKEKEGYDQAVKDVLKILNKERGMFLQQGSKTEAIVCFYLFRLIEELLQCEMDIDERE